MDFVFSIDASNQGKLKAVLEANPFENDSFAKLGYVLRESKAVGLPGGKFVVFFETGDDALAKKLCEKIKAVEGVAELSGGEKAKIVAQIKGEQDAAAQGFGSIFG